jgi:hypothetical protein
MLKSCSNDLIRSPSRSVGGINHQDSIRSLLALVLFIGASSKDCVMAPAGFLAWTRLRRD